jgi:hypothetical protein
MHRPPNVHSTSAVFFMRGGNRVSPAGPLLSTAPPCTPRRLRSGKARLRPRSELSLGMRLRLSTRLLRPRNLAEGCRSGRTGRSRKPLGVQAPRGFKSLPLRLSDSLLVALRIAAGGRPCRPGGSRTFASAGREEGGPRGKHGFPRARTGRSRKPLGVQAPRGFKSLPLRLYSSRTRFPRGSRRFSPRSPLTPWPSTEVPRLRRRLAQNWRKTGAQRSPPIERQWRCRQPAVVRTFNPHRGGCEYEPHS